MRVRYISGKASKKMVSSGKLLLFYLNVPSVISEYWFSTTYSTHFMSKCLNMALLAFSSHSTTLLRSLMTCISSF